MHASKEGRNGCADDVAVEFGPQLLGRVSGRVVNRGREKGLETESHCRSETAAGKGARVESKSY